MDNDAAIRALVSEGILPVKMRVPPTIPKVGVIKDGIDD